MILVAGKWFNWWTAAHRSGPAVGGPMSERASQEIHHVPVPRAAGWKRPMIHGRRAANPIDTPLTLEAPGVRALRLHVGVDAPLAGLPVYAVLDLFVDIEHDRFWWWHGAALTASLLIALAAVFVFLAARGFVEPVPAVLIALAFGLGSCAWAGQQPGAVAASGQHLVPQPGRLVAAAQRGGGRWLPPGAGRRSAWRCCAAPPSRWW